MEDTRRKMAAVAGFAVFVLLGLLNSACATLYTVGNLQGWIEYPSTSTIYDDQFRNITLHPNDQLLFPYLKGAHNVYEVSRTDLAACNANNPIAMYVDTNTTITLNRTGYYGFLCQIPTHCTMGAMHLAVNVSAATAPTPAPVPAPAPTPTPTTAPAPSPTETAPAPETSTPPPAMSPGEGPAGSGPSGGGPPGSPPPPGGNANSLASGFLMASAAAGLALLFL